MHNYHQILGHIQYLRVVFVNVLHMILKEIKRHFSFDVFFFYRLYKYNLKTNLSKRKKVMNVLKIF